MDHFTRPMLLFTRVEQVHNANIDRRRDYYVEYSGSCTVGHLLSGIPLVRLLSILTTASTILGS